MTAKEFKDKYPNEPTDWLMDAYAIEYAKQNAKALHLLRIFYSNVDRGQLSTDKLHEDIREIIKYNEI